MATLLHRARLNFIHRISEITPTFTGLRRFENVTRLRGLKLDGNSSGRVRDFTVTRLGSDRSLEPSTGPGGRWGWHQFEIVIAYPILIGGENANDLHEVMDVDRDDLILALDLATSWRTGIPSDASATTGIEGRFRTQDRLTDDGPVWLQTYRYNVKIQEGP